MSPRPMKAGFLKDSFMMISHEGGVTCLYHTHIW